MFCENCGHQISDTAKFCSACGHPVGTAPSPGVGAPPTVPAKRESPRLKASSGNGSISRMSGIRRKPWLLRMPMRMPPLWKTARFFQMAKEVFGTKRTGATASSIRSWRKLAFSRILMTRTASVNRSFPGSSPLIRPTPPGIHTPASVIAQVSTRIS